MGAEHVRVYQETNGEVGYMCSGAPILLLTTIGRRVRAAPAVPIIFGTDGEDILLIGSVGGAPKHPDWYFNIQANPAHPDQGQGLRGHGPRCHRRGEAPSLEADD